MKGRVDKIIQLDFETGDDEEYEVEGIQDSAVYTRESESHLPGLYYLVSWKGYSEEENTWSAVQHLKKLISSFYKDHLDKPIAISETIDSAPPMAKPIVRLTTMKQKRGRPAKNDTYKRAKKT